MNDVPIPHAFSTQDSIDLPPDQKEDLIITNEALINELIPPQMFSESERIRILAEITDIATHSHSNPELYEGCLQKIFDAIPSAERATILVDLDGELFPVKHFPREQAYYSETFVSETRAKRRAFSWIRKQANGKIPRSMFEAVAAMYAPMVRMGKVAGVLHVDSRSLTDGFTKSELDTLSVIASILALALQPGSTERLPPSVFISYSHQDVEIANTLKGDLRRNGISVWIDERLRVADLTWKKQLEIAIRKQKFLMFLLTPESISSEYCQWELDTARSSQKDIIPLLIRETPLPTSIADQQYIDFREDYRKALDLLVETINRQA